MNSEAILCIHFPSIMEIHILFSTTMIFLSSMAIESLQLNIVVFLQVVCCITVSYCFVFSTISECKEF